MKKHTIWFYGLILLTPPKQQMVSLMLDIAQLRVGEKVHYVSHRDGDWVKYQDYTSALTNIRDLRMGWES